MVAAHPTLTEATRQKLKKIGQADLVIGLPTHQANPSVAAQVAIQAIAGAEQHFPDLKTILINVDTGQDNATRQAVQTTAKTDIPVITGRYQGVLGRGAAVCAIFHAAVELQATAIILLDSWTENITPPWIPGLAWLIINRQADLVRPRYHIPLIDGALNDLLFYPFSRAVWGVNLQLPAGGDFAISTEMAQAVLEQDIWDTEINRAGFDIWLSTFASVEGWRLAQTALGEKRYHAKRPSEAEITIFKEAVGTMLRQLHLRRHIWPQINQVRSLPTLTQFAPPGQTPSPPDYDPTEALESLVLGWIDHRTLWKQILRPENLTFIEYLAGQPGEHFYFPSDLWAKVVYDFAVVYNKGELDPDAIVTALYPLYLGRLAGFWPEVAGLTPIGRAGTVAAQGVEFEEHRSYLKERWRTYTP